MKRGDVVIVALHGDTGKPRPAVVIQSDRVFATGHTLVCPMTTTIREEIVQRRVFVSSSPGNGLKLPSQIMVDKIQIVRLEKCRDVIGHLDPEAIAAMDEALALIIGLLDQETASVR